MYNFINSIFMKTKNILIMSIISVFMVISFSSCVASYPLIDSSYYAEPVYSGTDNATPIYYQGRNYTYSGVKIIGDRNCPNGLYMRDMRIVRNGLLVTVTDGTGQRIYKQYDLRVYRQNVKDVFTPTSLNGIPLEVTIVVRGSGSSNYVSITDGSNHDTFRLRR